MKLLSKKPETDSVQEVRNLAVSPGSDQAVASVGRLPLVIGVTGHRDLRREDWSTLTRLVTDIFHMLKRDYPNTPLVLLSPLAEGADRLVARVALQEQALLVVPLPMPETEYLEDFDTQHSREEFADLLSRAELHFELPLRSPLDAVRAGGEARDRQYEQVGAYIARHSQILIALWDGASPNRTGGTSRIVQFQLEGVPEPYAPRPSPLDQVETGLVYHIVTPRSSNPESIGGAFNVYQLVPPDTAYHLEEQGSPDDARRWRHSESTDDDQVPDPDPRYHRIYSRLDLFNRDAVTLHLRLAADQAICRADFLPEDSGRPVVSGLAWNIDAFVAADSLAVYFRQRTQFALRTLALFALLSVLFLDLYAHVSEGRWDWFVYLYPVTLLMAAGYWYLSVKRPDVQNRYLDYRALAEGLRVQCFWRLAGVRDSVADHYLRKQRSELDWIRNAIRATDIAQGPSVGGDSPDGRDYELVLARWVDNQDRWFQGRTQRDQRMVKRAEWGVRALFIIGIVSGVALASLVGIHAHDGAEVPSYDFLRDILLVVSTLALVGAGVAEGYADKMAYADQSRQYRRMQHAFRRAAQHLRSAVEGRDEARADALIRELGQEALAENGDWVILHRARPIEVPKGG